MQRSGENSSLVWAIWGGYISYEGYQLDLGTLRTPGAGFLVFWAGMLLLGLALLNFAQGFGADGKKRTWKEIRWGMGLKYISALFAYALVFNPLGFVVSTFILLLFLFKGLDRSSWTWKTTIMSSTIIVVLCYLIFEVALEAELPPGILEEISKRLY